MGHSDRQRGLQSCHAGRSTATCTRRRLAGRPAVLSAVFAAALVLTACGEKQEKGDAARATSVGEPAAATAPGSTTSVAGRSTPAPGRGGQAATRTSASSTVLVLDAVRLLQGSYVEPLDAAQLFGEAWEGAAAALTRAGVTNVPPSPTYPGDSEAARALHLQSFPALERLAEGRLDQRDLTFAALLELGLRRQDRITGPMPAEVVQAATAASRGEAAVQVGLTVSPSTPPRILAVGSGSPAQAAGLRGGERVLALNGRTTEDLHDARALLALRAGVPNTFTVRDADGRTHDVTVTPARYLRPGEDPPELEEHAILPGNIGLLRFSGSADGTQALERLRAVLSEFEAHRVQGWIIDVRENSSDFPAVHAPSLFVEARQRLFREIRREGPPRTLASDGSPLPYQRPLVILVGPGTAWGAERFAAALQALGRATLVGERTQGRGFGIPQSYDMADGSTFTVTTGELLLGPDERRLIRAGITPDITVALTPADEAAGRDPQLDVALRLMNDRLQRR